MSIKITTNRQNGLRVTTQPGSRIQINTGGGGGGGGGTPGVTDLTPANNWANTLATAGNTYTVTVGAASNNWANLIGTSGNSYTVIVGAASNTWANAVGDAGNNYSISIGAASNTWANTLVSSGNNYANSIGASSNAYANSVGASSNSWANTIGTAGNSYASILASNNAIGANSWANTLATAGNNYTNSVGIAGNAYTDFVGTSANSYAGYMANSANAYATTTYVKLSSPSSQLISSDIGISGNLTISGNVTYANTQQLLIGDNILTLNADLPLSVTPTENAGIEVNRGNKNANAALLWIETACSWSISSNTLNPTSTYIASNTLVETYATAGNSYVTVSLASVNAWSNSVGNAGNNYAVIVGAASNTWANTVGNAGNNYTNYVGTSANSYAGYMANSANAYAASLTPNLGPAFNQANNAYTVANAAFDAANNISGGQNSIPAFNQANLAYSVANSKTYTFYQSSAPATSNAHDLWVNSDTGVVYENFGTTSAPIWAEFGPSTTVANITPGVVSTTNLVFSDATYQTTAGATTVNATAAFAKANSANVLAYNTGIGANAYTNTVGTSANAWSNTKLSNTTGTLSGDLTVTGNVTINKQTFVNYTPSGTTNAAVEISSANTKGGTGYADVLKLTNIVGGTPNPTKWIRINTLGGLEVVNSAYNMACAILTDAGAFTTAGAITPGAWTAGQVIKDTMLSNSDLTVSTTTVATSGSDTDFVSYSYTPVSSSSYLIIHMHVASYDAGTSAGTGTDSYISRIKVDGAEITWSKQYTRDNYTFRTGVLFPLIGRYTNSSTSAKSITVGVRRDSADDNITITNNATSLWMRITEIAR